MDERGKVEQMEKFEKFEKDILWVLWVGSFVYKSVACTENVSLLVS